jgi:hypothetical protein
MITRAAKNGQRGKSFFQAAEYAKEAWMLASPGFKIGRRHSNSDSRAGVESKIRRKGSANFAKRRIVDRELHPVERHFAVPLASPERLPPLSDSEVVQNFDQTKACRKAKDQTAILFHQARKCSGDWAKVGDAVQSGEVREYAVE